ncbi:MAG: trehalase [Acidobacteriaceae bacterium]|nr:trehalase [Acidobacteriaceae bacterium]
MTPIRRFSAASLVFASLLAAAGLLAQNPSPQTNTTDILAYVKQTWTVLTRSNKDLPKAAVDPKFHPDADGRWPVFVPHTENASEIESALQKEIPPDAFKAIVIKVLPEDTSNMQEQGLLYLPKPYVVPGGRFNEMYGWDSYFIQLGLLRDNELELSKDMVDNFLYEIKNYGKILNANRTYYLGRSQPPFLTEMVLGVYKKTQNRESLESALPLIESYYKFWTAPPHLTEDTGLSRYWDFGEGPAPEVLASEKNAQGLTHYELVKQYFRTHKITDYEVDQYYDRKTDQLTPLFYKGDRSMRESGFDPSNRFGAFNIDIIHYNPVCLNSLLYVMEMQTADILKMLGNNVEETVYRKYAQERAERINRLMWDDKDGLYYDYDFQIQRVRHYPFLTTFFPLWAGFASKKQAARVEKNLPLFEKVGGLQTSTTVSGNQWDAPFGWAPLQMIAVDGLRRYGYKEDAERISMKFLSLVRREFLRQGYIVEKYDVVNGGSNVAANIHFGYSANQAGFGWTNAVFTELYDQLTPEDQKKLMAEPGSAQQ